VFESFRKGTCAPGGGQVRSLNEPLKIPLSPNANNAKRKGKGMQVLTSLSVMLLVVAPCWSINTNRVNARAVSGFGAHNYSLPRNADNAAEGPPRVANGKIAFVSNRADGASDLYVMNADGSGSLKLTNNPPPNREVITDEPFVSSPSWSPDGARLAFANGTNANRDIYVMNPDGSGLKKLTVHDQGQSCFGWYNDQLRWSPDGTKLTFVSGGIATGASAVPAVYNSSTQSPCDDGRVNIYVMNADG